MPATRSSDLFPLLRDDRWPALLLFVASALFFSLSLYQPGHPDEFYHILAARGLLVTGEPRIAEGTYTRGLPFTWLVAGFFWLFGDSVAVARLPSVLATAAVVAILFLWVRRACNPLAAWLTTLLYATSPFALSIANFSRFYALQTLSILLGTWLVFVLSTRPLAQPRSLVLALIAAAFFAFAMLLQPTTLINMVGLGAWLILFLLSRQLAAPNGQRHARRLILAGLFSLAVVLVGLWASGTLAELWHLYRQVPLFNRSQQDAFWFYHFWYVLHYPTFWPLTGLFALLACLRWPRLGSLALTVFAVAFVLHSFAGPKNLRYIAHAQPMLFVIWGLGLAALWPFLRAGLSTLAQGLVALLPGERARAQLAGRLLVAAATLFCVLANPAPLRTVALLAGITLPGEDPPVYWEKARAELLPWFARAEVVITTEELATLYYFVNLLFHGRNKISRVCSKLF